MHPFELSEIPFHGAMLPYATGYSSTLQAPIERYDRKKKIRKRKIVWPL